MLSLISDILTSFNVSLDNLFGKYGFVILTNTPSIYWGFLSMSLMLILVSYLYGNWSRGICKEIYETGKGSRENPGPPLQRNEEEGNHMSNFPKEDYSKYIEDLDDDNLSPAQKNMISRIKIARQKAIHKKVEENLSQEDKKFEKMAESQQLARIYSLLNQNQDKFGKVSIEDLHNQMDMYKAN